MTPHLPFRKAARHARRSSTGHGGAHPNAHRSSPIRRSSIAFEAAHRPFNDSHSRRAARCTNSNSISQLACSAQIPIEPAAPSPPTMRGFLVWGFFCQGVRRAHESFVLRQFLRSISEPVSSSRPALRLRRRAQKRSRLAVTPILRQAPPLPGHTLTASSTTARRVRSG